MFRQAEGAGRLLKAGKENEISGEQINYFREFLRSRGIKEEDILIFTTFKTGNHRKKLLMLSNYLSSITPPAVLDIEHLNTVTRSYPGIITGTYHIYRGHARIMTFQKGTPPFFDEGSGGIDVDENGVPAFSRFEEVRFTFSHAEGISGKNPCALYVHGTGGTAFTVFEDLSALNMNARGISVMSFDSPLHGERMPDHWDPTFTFFNFMNLIAARDNIRETALEIHQFITLLMNFKIDSQINPDGKLVECDPEKILFMGHSQGAITGIPYLGVDHRTKGAVISGGGGVLIYSLIHKSQPFPIQPLLRVLFGKSEELQPYHLLLNIFQIFFEPSDPAVYAPFVVYDEELSPEPVNLFVSEGMEDGFTPPETAESLCGAGLWPQVEPVSRLIPLYRIDTYRIVHSSPVKGNFLTPAGERATVGFIQFPGEGHFALFDSPCGYSMWGNFFQSLIHSEPVIDTSCLNQ
uniref:Lipase n=1 Tax=uncultured prokaryote TaxID=198431 RepID=H5SPW7_9ZZZZ|nr:lipase [uncultured prokaryote]